MRKYLYYIKQVVGRLLLGKFYNANFLAAEIKAYKKNPVLKSNFSFFKRMKCFLNGFNSDKLVWYDFINYKKEDYISDLVHFRDFEAIDWKYYYIAHNKLVCEKYFSHDCNYISTLAYIEKGKIFDISSENSKIDSIESLREKLNSGVEYYLKPYDGGSGRGIGKLWVKNNLIYWNHEIIENNNLETIISSLSGYLIQQKFIQEGYFHVVNPETLNTLRVVTMLHPQTHEPFITYAVQRFGRKETFVDNIAANGILCPINLETGKIEYAVIYPSNGVMEKVDKHPDTGMQIADITVPNWEDILSLCKKLALKVPFLPLCGWDIVLSNDEIFVQELNYNPDIYLGQILSPLLLRPEVKAFYDYYTNKKS